MQRLQLVVKVCVKRGRLLANVNICSLQVILSIQFKLVISFNKRNLLEIASVVAGLSIYVAVD